MNPTSTLGIRTHYKGVPLGWAMQGSLGAFDDKVIDYINILDILIKHGATIPEKPWGHQEICEFIKSKLGAPHE